MTKLRNSDTTKIRQSCEDAPFLREASSPEPPIRSQTMTLLESLSTSRLRVMVIRVMVIRVMGIRANMVSSREDTMTSMVDITKPPATTATTIRATAAKPRVIIILNKTVMVQTTMAAMATVTKISIAATVAPMVRHKAMATAARATMGHSRIRVSPQPRVATS